MPDVPLYRQKASHMIEPGSTFSYEGKRWRLLRLAKHGEMVAGEALENRFLNKWWAVPVRGNAPEQLFCFDHVIDMAALKLKPA